jgi:hypothetical protein
VAGDHRPSAVGRQQRGEDPYRRGLACAVGPEEPEDLAWLDRQIEIHDGELPSEPLGETFGQDGVSGHTDTLPP